MRDSLLLTLDDAFAYWNYDLDLDFGRSYRINQIQREALRVPGVIAAESWSFKGTRRVRPDGTESDSMAMVAMPADTKLLNPTLIAGRWLVPDDENALVINTDLLKDEEDLGVGSEVIFKIDTRDTTWKVVGVVRGVLTGPLAYANYDYFSREIRAVGQASGVRVITEQHDEASQARVGQALEAHYESLGMNVSTVLTIAGLQSRIEFQFNIIVVFLLIMAVLLAVVGGLGLMGTMSINVIERTREIGVMRAIGASNRSVLQIFMVEGLLIGTLSWLIGSMVAIPLSKLMSDMVGQAFLRAPLSYVFSITGTLIWLGLVLFLAGLASFIPAWNASRLTVRDVLAYE